MEQKKDYTDFLREIKDADPKLGHKDAQQKAKIVYTEYKNSLTKEPVKEEEKTPEVVEQVKEQEEKPVISFNSHEEFQAAIKAEIQSVLAGYKEELKVVKKPAVQEVITDPVVFFTYSHSHTCMIDLRNGQHIVPDEPIRFEHSYRYQVGAAGAQADKMVTISTFKTNQRSLIDFLRNHSLFNIMYFEDISKVEVRDALFATMIGSIATSVNQMGTHQLVNKAKMLPGVKITQDMNNLRHQVINALTEMEVNAHRKKSQLRMRETLKESANADNQGVNIGNINAFSE